LAVETLTTADTQ